MARMNEAYTGLQGSYLFSEVAAKVADLRRREPERDILSLGIGDVAGPLVPAVVTALREAVEEMGRPESFRGYGPERGYAFLREAIAGEYAERGVSIRPEEIFIGDGAKSDIGNFQELFSPDALVAVTDPVYPVYVDSNIMAGRCGGGRRAGGGKRILYLPCNEENGFVPPFPEQAPDFVYLCYPNNPTGTVLTREQLRAWVEYARKHETVILHDAAYEAFVRDPEVPRSIYEIEGAEEAAVEFRSYSKTAGFTGLRCGFTVVPQKLNARDASGAPVSLSALWSRRQSTKYNGCPYIVQRAAAVTHGPEGQRQVREAVAAYMDNAALIVRSLESAGLRVIGGRNAPYVWTRAPSGLSSWEFFAYLLEKAGVVCTPGAGFGPSGEGYVRFTAFASPQNTREALSRLARVL